jgi:hypothetical protein
MAKMKDTLCVDTPLLNDCIICDCEATAQAEGRTSWSVSIHGQPLCGSHWREIQWERSQ